MGSSRLTSEDGKINGTQTSHEGADFDILTSIRADHALALNSKNTLLSCGTACAPSPFYMLQYHRDRMLKAVKELEWTKAYDALLGIRGLSRLRAVLLDYLANLPELKNQPQPLKLRVAINPQSHISVTSTPLPIPSCLSSLAFALFPPVLSPLPPRVDHPLPRYNWRVFISPIPVSPSLFTRHKTTNRSVYDEARSFIPTLPPSDVPKRLCEVLLINHEKEVMEGSITTPYFWRGGQWVTPPLAAGGNWGTTRRYALEAGLCVEGTVTKDSLSRGELIWLSNGARGWDWGEIEMLE
ncbi:MAG: hypothetical protein L6R39_001203 [Caloplaca ligustica]|nr:MAG: hypothetical protein L6R39_001203 [Caloplaca ligustica]